MRNCQSNEPKEPKEALEKMSLNRNRMEFDGSKRYSTDKSTIVVRSLYYDVSGPHKRAVFILGTNIYLCTPLVYKRNLS